MRMMLQQSVELTLEQRLALYKGFGGITALPRTVKAARIQAGEEMDTLLLELCPGFLGFYLKWRDDDGPNLGAMYSRPALKALDNYLAATVREWTRKAA